MLRVGVDTGGTNTDLVAIDENGGIVVAKRPSTAAAPEIGVLNALDGSGIAPEAVRHFVLGTTIATNARLQNTGARVIYLATAGFEDIPLIGSISRPHAYDLSWRRPEPGVARRDCLGVRERIDYHGDVITALEDAEIARVLDEVAAVLGEEGHRSNGANGTGAACSIAVNFLFSYRNPAHEAALGAALRERFPGLPVSLSHEVAPIWREYHRATTTILAASVRPILQSFITDLERELEARSLPARLAIMKSNGGQMLSERAPDRTAEIFLSGLAGGVIGGHYFAAAEGAENAVTFDMGGTSCDVGMIEGGDYRSVPQIDLDWGIHVVAPHIDFTTIGAGGGSIAYVGQDGLLKVGPQSAGAEPGPACYGKGGTEPTVTDANVVLGRIDPDYFLGGRMPLDSAAARAAVATVAEPLGLTVEEAALTIVETVNDNMATAVRRVTIERGLDYRDFDLIAFGGAGPVHGAELARAVGMRRTLVPPYPGLCSAFGTVVADVRVEKSRTVAFRSDTMALGDIAEAYRSLEEQAVRELLEEGFEGEPVIARSASARYRLQSHEIELPVTPSVLAGTAAELVETFHAEHERRFDFKTPGHPVEIVRLTVLALGASAPPRLPGLEPGETPEPAARRVVWFRGTGAVETPVYQREALGAGITMEGPAVILEEDSTVIVAPDDRLIVHGSGVLEIAPASGARRARPQGKSAAEDMVTLNVIRNRLDAICDEMDLEALRTAHSPLFSESKDFSCMLFNRDLELISQAQNNPAIICAGLNTVPFVVEELGEDYFEPGDVVVHNDPYRGSCHMPEHMLLEGIFVDGELVGYAAIIAHIAEIGGMVPGSFAVTASEVYQEGLRLPPIKLMKRGEHVEELWKVILANHRTPDATFGDFHAMLASLKVAGRRFPELIRDYGVDTIEAATKALMAASERWMREQIKAIPDGTYSFEDRYEDDPRNSTPHVFRVDVTVDDDEILVDYSRSDKQVDAAINLTYVATAAASYTGILQSINVRDVPLNQGVFRTITMICPPGSLLNVEHPGSSVGGNSDGQPQRHQRDLGRHVAGPAGANLRRRWRDQLPVADGRRASRDRRVFRPPPSRRRRLGRAARRGRQRQPVLCPRQHDRDHAHRDSGEPLPAASSRLRAAPGFRRAGAQPGRPLGHAPGERVRQGTDGERAFRPSLRGPLGFVRRKGRRHPSVPGQAGGRHGVPHLLRGLRVGEPDQVRQRQGPRGRRATAGGAGGRRLRRPAGAGTGAGARRRAGPQRHARVGRERLRGGACRQQRLSRRGRGRDRGAPHPDARCAARAAGGARDGDALRSGSRVGGRHGALGRDRKALVRGQDRQLLALRANDRAPPLGG